MAIVYFFIGVAVLIALVVMFAVYVKNQQKRLAAFMANFGQQLGLAYASEADPATIPGTILNPASPNMKLVSKRAYNVLSGSIDGADIRIFHYSCMQKPVLSANDRNREDSVRNYYTVFEDALPRSMPDILVMPHIACFDWAVGEVSNAIGIGEQIKLEGDFYKHFMIYVDRGSEQDAYQLFTPDVMQKLEERFQNSGKMRSFTFEIVGTKLCIHIPHIIKESDELSARVEDLKFLAGMFKMNIEHFG